MSEQYDWIEKRLKKIRPGTSVGFTGDPKRKSRLDEQLVKFSVRCLVKGVNVYTAKKEGVDKWARSQAKTRGLNVYKTNNLAKECDLLVAFMKVKQGETWDVVKEVMDNGRVVYANLHNMYHEKWKILLPYHIIMGIEEW